MPQLIHSSICGVLIDAGYIRNDYDPCLFIKTVNGEQVTIAFNVDDLLITSTNPALIDEIQEHLQANFEAITVNRSDKHADNRRRHRTRYDSIHRKMHQVMFGRKVRSPATEDLFDVPFRIS